MSLMLFFQAVKLATHMPASEPEFYRPVLLSMFQECEGEIATIYFGNAHLFWKGLIKQAINAGYLESETEPDAFAFNLSQSLDSALFEWANGVLSLEEMEVRTSYHVAISLSAMATRRSHTHLQSRIQEAQNSLRSIWQKQLQVAMQAGPLDEMLEKVAEDQLATVDQDTESAQSQSHSLSQVGS